MNDLQYYANGTYEPRLERYRREARRREGSRARAARQLKAKGDQLEGLR